MLTRFGVSILGALLVVSASASAQVRSPYIQQTTGDSVTVVWQAETREPGIVCYGATPEALGASVASSGEQTTHVLTPSGLEPSTRYFYSAGASCAPVAHPDDFFVTAPVIGSSIPFRAWIVGDSGTGGSAQAAVRDAMLDFTVDERPDLFLHMGDMAYSEGTTTEFTSRFFDVYSDVLRNTPCWPTMGNHEGYTSDSASQAGPYYDAYVLPTRGEAGGMPSGTEAYYSYDYANAHFVVLESYETDRDPDGAMLSWLREDLAATDQEWIIAYWHHPPYTKGSHDSDTEGRLITMREDVLPILDSAGVDLVLGGHSHIYERSYLLAGGYETPSTAAGILDGGDGRSDGDGAYQTSGVGAVYIVSGHGGTGLSQLAEHPVMYFADTQHGSNLLDINGSTLTVSNLLTDGSINDVVTIDKSDGINVLHPRFGDDLLVESPTQVRWTSRGAGDWVHVDYSLDAGVVWYRAGDRVSNDGQFEWNVPAWPTSEGMVRVREVDGDAEDLAGPFSLGSRSDIEVLRYGSMWEYSDSNTAPPASWRTSSGSWPSGAAQLGYGEGDEATVLHSESPNIPTAYFRTRVEIDGEPVAGIASVLFDDGYVLWVNGIEVARENVGAIAHEDYGTSLSSDDEVEVTAFTGGLRNGTNDVAVLVKQRSTGSSDLSFDLALTVTVESLVDARLPTDPLVEPTVVEDAEIDIGADVATDTEDDASFDVPPDLRDDALDASLEVATDATPARDIEADSQGGSGDSDVDHQADVEEDENTERGSDSPLGELITSVPETDNVVLRGSGCATSPTLPGPWIPFFLAFLVLRRRQTPLH